MSNSMQFAKILLRPICWLFGHRTYSKYEHYINKDTYCRLCGKKIKKYIPPPIKKTISITTIMKKKQPFYTEAFYANPQLTLDILNKLVEDGHVADKDMYQSGTFLFMDVFENDETKKILSAVISDLEAYKKHNNEGWVSDESTEIGICALQDDHRSCFYFDGKEIKWDHDRDMFVFENDL